MILKMLSGNVIGIVDVKTLSVGNHDVARSAEFCSFGALHMGVHSSNETKAGEHAQCNEGHNLPAGSLGQRRTKQKDGGQDNAKHNLTNKNSYHRPPDAPSGN